MLPLKYDWNMATTGISQWNENYCAVAPVEQLTGYEWLLSVNAYNKCVQTYGVLSCKWV